MQVVIKEKLISTNKYNFTKRLLTTLCVNDTKKYTMFFQIESHFSHWYAVRIVNFVWFSHHQFELQRLVWTIIQLCRNNVNRLFNRTYIVNDVVWNSFGLWSHENGIDREKPNIHSKHTHILYIWYNFLSFCISQNFQ